MKEQKRQQKRLLRNVNAWERKHHIMSFLARVHYIIIYIDIVYNIYRSVRYVIYDNMCKVDISYCNVKMYCVC